MHHKVYPVILSGGVGKRLWPSSREKFPKQFIKSSNEKNSFFENTIKRIKSNIFFPPTIIGNFEHRFLINEALEKIKIKPRAILLEPLGKNTSAAVTLSSLHIFQENPDAIVLVMPSDHLISDSQKFAKTVLIAKSLASSGMLVTFGVPPTRPETGYGYIKRGNSVDGGFAVDHFVEKPDQETAERYFASGDYYWNAGIFVFRADCYLSEVRRINPEIFVAAQKSLDLAVSDLDFLRLDEGQFKRAPEISIDVAIFENTKNAAVIPLALEWNDIGSWAGLSKVGKPDLNGNVCVGDSIIIDAHDNYIHTEKPLVAVLGIDGIALIATDDSVLVVPKSRSQEVKNIVMELESQNRDEVIAHSRVDRPWGYYLNIDSGESYLVKQIVVNPGARLSLQYHNHRAEHWVVVEGIARVTNGEKSMDLFPNQSTYIPVGTKHRLENLTYDPLRLIEVQTGEIISEDDIVREDDTYGRV